MIFLIDIKKIFLEFLFKNNNFQDFEVNKCINIFIIKKYKKIKKIKNNKMI